MGRKRKAEAHVRLYRHELECEAYRSLSTDARALLVEFRALYDGRENRLPMSVRQIMRRLGIGQRRAQQARDDLVDRGFIRLLSQGGFNRKFRHASEYALTNEPLNPNRDGATASKDFMKWRPQKITVGSTATDGGRIDYRDASQKAKKTSHGSHSDYRKQKSKLLHGSQYSYTDKLPGAPSGSGGSERMLWTALAADGEAQFKLCFGYVLILVGRMDSAA